MTNIHDPKFEEPHKHDGFRAKRARIGRQLGAERLGLSLWEIPPGEASYPFHFHLGEEEIAIVLRGTATLRSPEGMRMLADGDAIRFPRGEEGGHQLLNDGPESVRVLSISTVEQTDIVVYPDSGKICVVERDPQGDGLYAVFRHEDRVDYWEGEHR